jgi:glycosyltransferase involved in cell wall biosynthesis
VSATIVIPCYNEAERLDRGAVNRLIAGLRALDHRNRVLLVDDGSTDATATMLRDIEAQNGAVRALILPENGGKAEAVRRGLTTALESGASIVGFADADFATPPEELTRLLEVAIRHPEDVAVLGSRVLLLGHAIDRSPKRHYVGRIFATIAGPFLGVGAYDSQCGAKFFRDTPAMRAAVSQPFRSRWGFDLELLGRLQGCGIRPSQMREEPLNEWRDVGGSKVTTLSGLRTFWELVSIRRDLRKWADEHRDTPQIAAAS